MPIKIGIPRGLLYYSYNILWEKFFTHLGAELIVSDKTNNRIVTDGIKNCVEDACFPVKVYHGHVISLKEITDYIFIPKAMSIREGEYICPKFCGLPEMIRHSIDGLPKIIEPTINLRDSKKSLMRIVYEVGSSLKEDKAKINNAFEKAMIEFEIYKNSVKKGFIPLDGTYKCQNCPGNDGDKLLVLGHPYVIYDSYMSMNLINKLRKYGFNILTQDNIDSNFINEKAATMNKRMFWTFGRRILGAALYAMEQEDIKGIIYLSSFACGLDSVIGEIVERRIRRNSKKPFTMLTIDEHTGEAGFDTRLEAFVDMIGWRENNDSHISAYGKYISGGEGII